MGMAHTIVERLALGIAYREARDRHRLASQWIPTVLEVEESCGWRIVKSRMIPRIPRPATILRCRNLVVLFIHFIATLARYAQDVSERQSCRPGGGLVSVLEFGKTSESNPDLWKTQRHLIVLSIISSMTTCLKSSLRRFPVLNCSSTRSTYQLGMVEQVRQNLEKANQRVYGKGRVLRFHDVPSPAEVQQEAVVCK